MRASRLSYVLAVLFSFLFTVAISSPAPAERDHASFQQLLSDVSSDSIHKVLHEWSTKFQDGIFSKDITAIEMVHSENAHLATKLVNLAKRQGGTSSNSTVTPTTTSSSPVTTTTPPTTTPTTPSSSRQSSSSHAPSSGSTTIAPSTTPPAVTTSSTLVPASSPSSASPVSTSSNGVVFSSSNGGMTTVPTSSKPVTYRPSSSTVLSTTTLPDGSQSTMTSFTVVNAPDTNPAAAPTGSAGAGSGSGGSGSGNPSLQTGAASATREVLREVVLVMGGAVAVAMALQ
ncbi:MAG: hypothetical protein Q9227_006710 [Pyrenula ochraceoflavens]